MAWNRIKMQNFFKWIKKKKPDKRNQWRWAVIFEEECNWKIYENRYQSNMKLLQSLMRKWDTLASTINGLLIDTKEILKIIKLIKSWSIFMNIIDNFYRTKTFSNRNPTLFEIVLFDNLSIRDGNWQESYCTKWPIFN